VSDFEIDHQRDKRLGFPEVIYGESKTDDQLEGILTEYQSQQRNVLITRLQPEKARHLLGTHPEGIYDPVARTFIILYTCPYGVKGTVGILSGGTSDAPVVKETANTLAFLGFEPICYNDVGVAGIHRLLEKQEVVKDCDVIITVAGFEGALASVTGGLFPQPVIAVPTSIGYGVASGGQAALHAMLSSCANGVLVCNIDNGCGAALAAARILHKIYES